MYPGKEDCLFLDYGGNILRHGPIDKIEVAMNRTTGEREVSTTPMKECPECQTLLYLSARECFDCGYVFPDKEKHEREASEADILSRYKKPVEYVVKKVVYGRHEGKKGKIDTVRVDYYHDMFNKVSEWVCIEHEGYARKKAEQWLKDRTDKMYNNITDLLFESEKLCTPNKIIVDINGKFPQIIGHLFQTEEEKETEILEGIM